MFLWQRIYPGKKSKAPEGFTLVELLVSITIFAAVSGAIYATFSCGMSVWRRMQEMDSRGRKPALRIEKLSRELRGVLNFNEIPFSGSGNQITFAGILDSEINRITYSFDLQAKTLYRSTDKFSDILAAKKESAEFSSHPLPYWAGEINSMSFSYLYFDLAQNAYLWKEKWIDPVLPLAVKIEITTDNDAYTKTVFIPIA